MCEEGGGETGEEEEEHLVRTFQQIQELTEDLDNANSRTHSIRTH